MNIFRRFTRRIASPSDPIRCTFVITSMPVGGAETLLVNLMRRMDSQKIIPDIVCLKEPGPLGEVIASEFDVQSHFIGSKWDIGVLARLIRHFRRRRTDVVITVGAGDKMFWGRLAAALAGVPGIASALHSTGWPDGVGRLNRWLTPITDAFIAVADSHGEFLRNFEKFPAERVHVIRNGVDCDRFVPKPQARVEVRRELGLPADAPLIGIVAALREEKNHGLFVQAAQQVLKQHPGAHFLIIGEGPMRQSIETAIDEVAGHGHIHLLGTRHDTPDLLAAMDVFVLSSLNEASPVSILEALSCGVPVVATDVGSVCETVRPNETGYLVPSQERDAMVQAIDDLLRRPEHARELGANGREWVRATGSLQSMVDGYTKLSESIARGTLVSSSETQRAATLLSDLAVNATNVSVATQSR
jgi:glycosyltransferase involved in cell wall biosynthesis